MIYKHTCPHSAKCLALFEQKQQDPHAQPSLFTPSHPKQLFFLSSQMKNILKGKCFANVEEVKQKTAEALKGIKIDKFKIEFKPS